MKTYPSLSIAVLAMPILLSPIMAEADSASDATFLPGRFSHDWNTGEQIVQHTPRPNPPKPYDPTYRRSGVNYRRSVTRTDDGSLKIRSTVESWGSPWPYGYGYGYGYHPSYYRPYPGPYHHHPPYPVPYAGYPSGGVRHGPPAASGAPAPAAKQSGPVRIGR
jgi:hypothetical protein